MPYIPPSCDSVNFTLRPIVIPLCNAVNFDMTEGGAVVIGISIQNTLLNLISTEFFYVSAEIIQIEDTYINLYVDDATYQVLAEISPENSTINLYSETELVRILPDIIIHDSVLNFTSEIMNVRAGRVQDLPNKIDNNGGLKIEWGGLTKVEESTDIPWKDALYVDEFISINTGEFTDKDAFVSDSWKVIDHKDNKVNISVNNPLTLCDHFVSFYWNVLFIVDQIKVVNWGSFNITDSLFYIPYRQPGPVDVQKVCDYDIFEQCNIHFSFDWYVPGSTDKHQEVPWGPISLFHFCSTKYYPPTDGVVNFKLLPLQPDMIGVCYQVGFAVEGMNTDPRCPYHHHQTGRRDPYISTEFYVKNLIPGKYKEVYYMLNTVFVKTVITNTPIHVLGLSAVIDKKSWLWQFNLIVGTRSHLDLIIPEPVSGGEVVYKDIEININGWKFTCRVESYSENRQFAKDAWNVVGRSPSMELGNPQNPVSSFTYIDTGGGTAGAQIMEEILKGTMLGRDDLGWRLDWTYYNAKIGSLFGFDPTSAVDWGFPDGVFSWTDKTQIEAVMQLTESIKAYVQTVPDCATDKRLLVRPDFHIPPWHWAFNSEFPQNIYRFDVDPGDPYHIDHRISEAICRDIGRSFVSYPSYNGVFVMGQASVPAVQGNTDPGVVFVDVFRDNGDPILRAPNYTNPWITSIMSAGEAGRSIICNTGEWRNHSLNLFTLGQYGSETDDVPGLILPGEYVQFTEKGTNLYGQVEGVKLEVSMVNGAVCKVSQIIEVNEYIGIKTLGA